MKYWNIAHLHEYNPPISGNRTGEITSHFDLGKEVSIVRSAGEESNEGTKFKIDEGAMYERFARMEEGNNSPNTESEDSDESFEFAPEIEEGEEFGDIKFKQLVEDHWRFCLEGETSE